MKNIYEVSVSNRRKSNLIMILFLLFTMSAIFFITYAFSIYISFDIGALGVAGIALIISGITSYVSYYYSDKIVLAISSAKQITKDDHFDLFTIVENLSIATALPMPEVYVIEDTAPNAFATGRNPENAVIVVTSGLLQKLNRTELEGVIAHEFSHIRNYDIRLLTIVSVLVGTLALLGDWFLRVRISGNNKKGSAGMIILVIGFIFALLSPIIGKLIQLAVSRRREFMADAGSVEITRQPSGLINALKKLSNDHEPLEAANKATAHLYIVNPFKDKIKDKRNMFSGIFNTHPPIEDRITELEKMS